jgi:hypothetical protein
MGHSRKPRKISRRITIDDVVYRYRVSPNDGFISLLVRLEGSKGQGLGVRFGYHDEWVPNSLGGHSSFGHRLILPCVVRVAIQEGLRRGWEPSATSPAWFGVPDGDNLSLADEWPRTRPRDDKARIGAVKSVSPEVSARLASLAESTGWARCTHGLEWR